MLPRAFEYFSPTSASEAARILKEHAGDAKVLAGGMSLIPLMKMRLASPGCIVDINGVEGLDHIKQSDDGRSLLIGALARHHALETSALARTRAPLLSETAGSIGDPQVRNRGTIGGALAHSDPSGDWGAAILAMRGSVKILGLEGERTVPIDDFLVDTFAPALSEAELVVEVSVPLPPRSGSGGAYLKLGRKPGDFATAGVAVQLTTEKREDGTYCTSAGVGLTALGPKSLRASLAESRLVGRKLTKETVAEASAAAAKECSPANDPLRGSASYKREMAAVLTRRAVEVAAARAQTRGGRAG